MNFEATMIKHLGIDLEVEENPKRLQESNAIYGTMPVDERTATPFSTLCGGASLSLAECLAGYGSFLLCKEGSIAVGIQVSGSHVASASLGDTVRARAKIVHSGKSLHTWTVEVKDSNDRLISTVTVTNMVIRKD